MTSRVRAACLIAMGVALIAASPATRPTTRPDATVRSRGLWLVSHYYLLEDDINLAESMRAMKAAQHKVDDYSHQQAAIETDIDSANGAVADNASAPPEATATTPASSNKIEVVSARWVSRGKALDVTDEVKQLIAAQQDFTPNGDTFHPDPDPGWRKQLQITIRVDGQKKVLKFPGGKVVHPEDLQP